MKRSRRFMWIYKDSCSSQKLRKDSNICIIGGENGYYIKVKKPVDEQDNKDDKDVNDYGENILEISLYLLLLILLHKEFIYIITLHQFLPYNIA